LSLDVHAGSCGALQCASQTVPPGDGRGSCLSIGSCVHGPLVRVPPRASGRLPWGLHGSEALRYTCSTVTEEPPYKMRGVLMESVYRLGKVLPCGTPPSQADLCPDDGGGVEPK
jgi:hypothetical protein